MDTYISSCHSGGWRGSKGIHCHEAVIALVDYITPWDTDGVITSHVHSNLVRLYKCLVIKESISSHAYLTRLHFLDF